MHAGWRCRLTRTKIPVGHQLQTSDAGLIFHHNRLNNARWDLGSARWSRRYRRTNTVGARFTCWSAEQLRRGLINCGNRSRAKNTMVERRRGCDSLSIVSIASTTHAMTLGARLRSLDYLLASRTKFVGAGLCCWRAGRLSNCGHRCRPLRWSKIDAGAIHYHNSRKCKRHNVLS